MLECNCLNCKYLKIDSFTITKETKDFLAFKHIKCLKIGECPSGIPQPSKLRPHLNNSIHSEEWYLSIVGCGNFEAKKEELTLFDFM